MVALARPGRYLAPYRQLVARSGLLRTVAFSRWGAADPLALSDAAVEGFLAGTRLHTDTLSAAEALVVDDPREALERIRCPVLVLWGARDNQLPMADAFEYARRLRGQLRTIADCGHLLIGERPDACLDAIESFLG
jgi:pimeloyl-ACP methyl ester carboxylesterase